MKNYNICQVDVKDSVQEKKLIDSGFRFLDRILVFEINIKKFKNVKKVITPDVYVTCDNEYSENMNNLAKKVFTTDRRFHLDYVFDMDKASVIIDEYINQCKFHKMKIYKVFHEDVLLGFAIVDENADEKGKFFENVLGCTVPGIKGKMVAPLLYEAVIDGERECFAKYRGHVSSANIESINLHIQLGGTIVAVYDKFIFRVDD